MIALNAHFDGKVLIPDEPLALPTNQKVRIQLEPIASTEMETRPKRVLGQQPDAILYIAPDFDDHLGDEFWLGDGNK
jgi:hypothetical protein